MGTRFTSAEPMRFTTAIDGTPVEFDFTSGSCTPSDIVVRDDEGAELAHVSADDQVSALRALIRDGVVEISEDDPMPARAPAPPAPPAPPTSTPED